MIAHLKKYEDLAARGFAEVEAYLDKRSRGAPLTDDDREAKDVGIKTLRLHVSAVSADNNAEMVQLMKERMGLPRKEVPSLSAAEAA